jgi:hypothetical protein
MVQFTKMLPNFSACAAVCFPTIDVDISGGALRFSTALILDAKYTEQQSHRGRKKDASFSSQAVSQVGVIFRQDGDHRGQGMFVS